jgi:hypothetical protein
MKIRQNVFVRILMKVFALLIMRIQRKRYKRSQDSAYIKTLHNKYKGERCFIIGNGPSLTVNDLDMLKNEVTIASNKIYDIFPYTVWRPNIYMCADKAMLTEIRITKPNLDGLSDTIMLCGNKKLVDRLRKKFNIHEIIMYGKYPIRRNKLVMDSVSEDVSEFFTVSQSVTCNMLELAFYLGIKEIYLLGVDHNFGIEIDMNGNTHVDKCVQHHFSQQTDKTSYPTPKEALTKCYEMISKYAEDNGIKIYNATRGGKLEVFERKKLEDVLLVSEGVS